MTTKILKFRNCIALMSWGKNKKVFVKWFNTSETDGLTETKEWPAKESPEKVQHEALLLMVMDFCSEVGLTLWSY